MGEENYPSVLDWEEAWQYHQVSLLSLALTLIGFPITQLLIKLYEHFTNGAVLPGREAMWMSLGPSTIHAMVVTPLAFYALLTETGIQADYIWGKSSLASSACAITIGYMYGDLFFSLYKWKEIGDWGFVFHHLMSIAAYTTVTHTGVFRFLAMMRLLAELSTPFVNLRHLLHDTGKKDSDAYFYNGLVMTGTFTCSRILTLPYYLYIVYTLSLTEAFQKATLGKWMIYTSTVILDSLNIMWFYKMISGAIKVWNSHKKATKSVKRSKIIKQG